MAPKSKRLLEQSTLFSDQTDERGNENDSTDERPLKKAKSHIKTVARKTTSKGRKTVSQSKPTETDAELCPQEVTHWLIKSEPESRFENGVDVKFSIDDLELAPNQTACWDGVRNYQARNFLRDQMKLDHNVFFYHSNCKSPGIIGICKVVRESYPDHTQFDSTHPHFDSSSRKDNPRWYMVDVKFVRKLNRFISLAELKQIHQQHLRDGGPLKNMSLFTRSRLSVQPLTKDEWDFIIKLENML